MRCAMTGQALADPSEGIWDDGEWISWSFINQHLEDHELREQFPGAHLDVVRAFLDLVEVAERYHALTDRYLEIWGELGELFVELKYGLKRHRIHAKGSDGRIGDDYVEVKTLSPDKTKDYVQVKRGGNFSKVYLVKVSRDFGFEARVIERVRMQKGKGTKGKARVSWKSCAKLGTA